MVSDEIKQTIKGFKCLDLHNLYVSISQCRDHVAYTRTVSFKLLLIHVYMSPNLAEDKGEFPWDLLYKKETNKLKRSIKMVTHLSLFSNNHSLLPEIIY